MGESGADHLSVVGPSPTICVPQDITAPWLQDSQDRIERETLVRRDAIRELA